MTMDDLVAAGVAAVTVADTEDAKNILSDYDVSVMLMNSSLMDGENVASANFGVSPPTTAMDRHQDLLRRILPDCQPQEGSPANTFTVSELQVLQAALSSSLAVPPETVEHQQLPPSMTANTIQIDAGGSKSRMDNRLNIQEPWRPFQASSEQSMISTAHANTTTATDPLSSKIVVDGTAEEETTDPSSSSGVAASTMFSMEHSTNLKQRTSQILSASDQDDGPTAWLNPRQFRYAVRTGRHTLPTNGVCPGFLQCNLVVLPAGKVAFDFLLFCQRNSQACPLLEVCEGIHSYHPQQLASSDADLRTDISKFSIYRDGMLVDEVDDCTKYWPDDAVAFLIGCSFSYDGALLAAGIPLRSAEAKRNVPMYRTNIACQPAGCLRGNLVVSMKPIPCTMISEEVEITSKYIHAHGGPVCVGCPSAIGIHDIGCPDWGDPISIEADEVPVFHACGVTPQAVLMTSRVPFAITHSAGHMFVTDQPSNMGCLL